MKPHANNSGFTIIEVLIASVILMIAVAGVTGAMRTSRNLQMDDLLRRQARGHLQSILETKVNYSIGNSDTLASTFDTTVSIAHLGGSINSALNLTGTPQSRTVDGVAIRTKQYSATITWSDPWSGSSQSLSLTKVIAALQ